MPEIETSTALGLKSEPQPDALFRITAEGVGRTQADRRFVHGVPEFLADALLTSDIRDYCLRASARRRVRPTRFR